VLTKCRQALTTIKNIRIFIIRKVFFLSPSQQEQQQRIRWARESERAVRVEMRATLTESLSDLLWLLLLLLLLWRVPFLWVCWGMSCLCVGILCCVKLQYKKPRVESVRCILCSQQIFGIYLVFKAAATTPTIAAPIRNSLTQRHTVGCCCQISR